jgi:segregation and condensation protein B
VAGLSEAPEPAPGAEGRDPRLRDLEAILFVTDEPLAAATLSQLIDTGRRETEGLLQQLSSDLEARGSGLVLRPVAGGWRLYTNPEAHGAVERFVRSSRHARLTKASLETLAIVAYKQPVTRHQVAAIRGVDSDGVLRSLVDRGLLAEVGRDEGPGRPLLFGTTADFLERLSLNSVGDLPALAPLLGRDEDKPEEDDGLDAAEPPSEAR